MIILNPLYKHTWGILFEDCAIQWDMAWNCIWNSQTLEKDFDIEFIYENSKFNILVFKHVKAEVVRWIIDQLGKEDLGNLVMEVTTQICNSLELLRYWQKTFHEFYREKSIALVDHQFSQTVMSKNFE